MKFAIVGARFRPPADDVLNLLPAGADLVLVRQPENPYDSNAIAVMVEWEGKYDEIIAQVGEEGEVLPNPLHLGYIPAKENSSLAASMDESGENLPAKLIFSLSGGPMVEC